MKRIKSCYGVEMGEAISMMYGAADKLSSMKNTVLDPLGVVICESDEGHLTAAIKAIDSQGNTRLLGTNSDSVISALQAYIDFAVDIPKLVVREGTSKSGRTYLYLMAA